MYGFDDGALDPKSTEASLIRREGEGLLGDEGFRRPTAGPIRRERPPRGVGGSPYNPGNHNSRYFRGRDNNRSQPPAHRNGPNYHQDRGGKEINNPDERERRLIRLKLIKLGDLPDRLVPSLRETARIIDAYLASDFQAFRSLKFLNQDLDVNESSVDEESASLRKLFFSHSVENREKLGSKTQFVLSLTMECIECLPHKHSYYATLFWVLIQECRYRGSTLDEILQKAYGGGSHLSALKGENAVQVKGEIIEEENSVNVLNTNARNPEIAAKTNVKGEGNSGSFRGHELADSGPSYRGAKDEFAPELAASFSPQTKTSGLDPSTANFKFLFFLHLAICTARDVWENLNAILYSQGGLHKISNSLAIVRFLADFVNLGLLDEEVLLGMTHQFLSSVETLLEEFQERTDELLPLFSLMNHLTLVGGQIPLWFSKEKMRTFGDRIADFIGRVEKIVAAFDRVLPRNELWPRFVHPLGCRKELQGQQLFSDSLHELLHSLQITMAREWISKAVPRLYESPKLKYLRQPGAEMNFSLPPLKKGSLLGSFSHQESPEAEVDESMDGERIFSLADRLIAWHGYCIHDTDRTNVDVSSETEKVALYQSPDSKLHWKEDHLPLVSLKVFSKECLEGFLDVQLLSVPDVWVTQVYIHDTLANFYKDPDNCAETLLYIPLKHDQFPAILIETLFTLCFNHRAPLTGRGMGNSGRISPFFLAQLLRRLCILEKSVVSIVHLAVEEIVAQVATSDEQFFHQFTTFLAIWMSYDAINCGGIVEILSRMGGVQKTAMLGKTEGLAAEMSDEPRESVVKEEVQLPRPYRPQESVIRSPLDSIAAFRTPEIRFCSHVIMRLLKLLPSARSCLTPSPKSGISPVASLHRLVPTFQIEASLSSMSDSGNPAPVKKEEKWESYLDDDQPHEARILKRVLKLMVKDSRESRKLCYEAFHFLESRVGSVPIAAIEDSVNVKIEEIVNPATPDAPSLKRLRVEEMEEPLQKDSNKLIKVDIDQREIELDRLMGAADEPEGSDLNSAAFPLVKGEPDQNDECEGGHSTLQAVLVKSGDDSSLRTNFLAQIEFSQLADDGTKVWRHSDITRILARTFIAVGLRTLSHFQKVVELYSPLLTMWSRGDTPLKSEEGEPTETDGLEFAMIDAAVEHWIDRDLSRLQWTLYVLLAHKVLKPISVFRYLVEGKSLRGPLALTVSGDYLFWDLAEAGFRLLASSSGYGLDYAAAFSILLKGCLGAYEEELGKNQMDPAEEFLCVIVRGRILRLLKMIPFFVLRQDEYLRGLLENLASSYPKCNSIGKICEAIPDMKTYGVLFNVMNE